MVAYWIARAKINDPVEYNQNIQAVEAICVSAMENRPVKVG